MGRPKGSKNGVYGHGTQRRYKEGCRCESCTEAHGRYLMYFRDYQRMMIQHGLTASEREKLKANGCWVCGSFFRLAIDHDHSCCPGRFSCGECVRGVLCAPCNRAIGYAKDDPKILLKLAEYLENSHS